MPWPPDPPVPLPAGRIVHVAGRGEFMVRDSGGDGPCVLLLHGWMVSADVNWWRMYEPLQDAGHRVIALDHRGHGRGLRTAEAFSLRACADDAAAVLGELEAGPVVACGYSMGGPIAQLLARHHGDRVAGLVLSATALDWSDPRTRRLWRAMGLLRLGLGLFPNAAWRRGLRTMGFRDSPVTSWIAAELSRASPRDMAEAGRDLGRFDSTEWAGLLDKPSVVIVTLRDTGVRPEKQRALAAAMDAVVLEVDGDHNAVVAGARSFAVELLRAVEVVGAAALVSPPDRVTAPGG